MLDLRDRAGRGPARFDRPPRRRLNADAAMAFAARSAAGIVLLMMAALLAVLFYAALPSIRTFGLSFITDSAWRPNELPVYKRNASGRLLDSAGEVTRDLSEAVVERTLPPRFGALPVIYGTFATSILALVFAVPLSLGCAIFLVRIAPKRLVAPVSFLVEFLAAIPSIAYGIWGLFVLAPFLQNHIEPLLNRLLRHTPLFNDGALTGRDLLAGGLILGVMILPIITAVSRDVLRAVPRNLIEGSLALGATWWQSCREMLRYSRSGLFGAVILGLARAAGETMAITMVIGNVQQIRLSPFAAAQTMSSLLANEFAEAEAGLHRSALLEVALILLVMSLLFNIAARHLVVGRRTVAAH